MAQQPHALPAHPLYSPSAQRPPPSASFPIPSNGSHIARALTYGEQQAQHAPGHPGNAPGHPGNAYQPTAPCAVAAPYAYNPAAAAAGAAGQMPVVQYAYVQVICFASMVLPLQHDTGQSYGQS